MNEKTNFLVKEEVYFEEAIGLFEDKSNNKWENRYKSWNHCYNIFHYVKDNIKDNKTKLDDELYEISNKNKWTYKDELALHLAFYMASWGMYRGSSFLLQNDYTIYKEVVEAIFDSKYDDLWDDSKLFSSENNVDKIKDLYYAIFEKLKPYKCYFVNKSYFKNETQEPQSREFLTIITKIILGTIGCFPALDRNFKQGFGLQKTSSKKDKTINNKTTNEYVNNCIKRVYELVCAKYEQYKQNNQNITKYPFMKQIDMYYFIKGIEDEFLINIGLEPDRDKDTIKNQIISYIDGNNAEKQKEVAKYLYNNVVWKDYTTREEYDILVANSNLKQAIDELRRSNIGLLYIVQKHYKCKNSNDDTTE